MVSDFTVTHTHTYTSTPTETCQPIERVLIDWLACKCFTALNTGQDTQSNAMLDHRCRRVPWFGLVSQEDLSIMLFIYTHETVVAPCVIPPTHALVRSTLRSFLTLMHMWADPSFCWLYSTQKVQVMILELAANVQPLLGFPQQKRCFSAGKIKSKCCWFEVKSWQCQGLGNDKQVNYMTAIIIKHEQGAKYSRYKATSTIFLAKHKRTHANLKVMCWSHS